MKERRSLEDRLENWAAVQRGGKHSATAGSVESNYDGDRYKENKSRVTLDLADAALVNMAWQRCAPHARELLRWHYVRRAHSDYICRRLNIAHRPASVWTFALYHAQQEIGSRIVIIERLQESKECDYNPRHRILNPAPAE